MQRRDHKGRFTKRSPERRTFNPGDPPDNPDAGLWIPGSSSDPVPKAKAKAKAKPKAKAKAKARRRTRSMGDDTDQEERARPKAKAKPRAEETPLVPVFKKRILPPSFVQSNEDANRKKRLVPVDDDTVASSMDPMPKAKAKAKAKPNPKAKKGGRL